MDASSSNLDAIFCAAIEFASLEERAEYVERACGGDLELRSCVEKLLAAHFGAGDFLEQPPAIALLSTLDNFQQEGPGSAIGPYKLLKQIGEGGMGVVFMAEQTQPIQRTVALKIIKPGMDTRQVIARFEAERQALALMDHPHIAKMLDAGTTITGRPYFVMELVKGHPIIQYCDEHRLLPNRRLELFITVCQAVQHAHQKGIIHRDLKPTNVLVADYDDRPAVKIIDFGVAKAVGQQLTERTMFTDFGQVVGTIEYMSPEQAKLSQLDIDTRTDIYSLGVLLYELLVGEPPFDRHRLRSAAFDEMLRIIREEVPPRPSTRLSTTEALPAIAANRGLEPKRLTGLVRGDLEWIVLKALEKDRTRRYESASGFAADVERYLNNEPIEAYPPTRLYRLKKALWRNKVAFIATAAVFAALTTGLGLSTWLYSRENAERKRAIVAEQLAKADEQKTKAAATKIVQVADFMKEMLSAVAPSVALGRDTTMLEEVLNHTAKRLDTDLQDQPEVEADLRYTLGSVYEDLEDYENAEHMHRRALELRQQLFGDTNDDVFNSQHRLGVVLTVQGDSRKYPEAEKLLRQVLANSGKIEHDPDLTKSKILGDLANVLRRQYKFDEAEASARESLAILKKTDRAPDQNLGTALDALANVLHAELRFHDAENVQREALELDRRLYGREHPNVATSLVNLGWLLEAQNKFSEAEPVVRDALAMETKFWGEKSSQFATTTYLLGSVLQGQGKLPEAELTDRQALVLFTKSGMEGFFVDAARTNLIRVLRSEGKLAELTTMYHEVEEAERTVDPKAHPDVATSPEELGYGLIVLSKFQEAENLERDVLPLMRAEYGNNSLHVAVSLCVLGDALSGEGKQGEAEASYAEAEPLIASAYEGMKQREAQISESDQRRLREALQRVVKHCSALGKAENAAEWQVKLTDFGATESATKAPN